MKRNFYWNALLEFCEGDFHVFIQASKQEDASFCGVSGKVILFNLNEFLMRIKSRG